MDAHLRAPGRVFCTDYRHQSMSSASLRGDAYWLQGCHGSSRRFSSLCLEEMINIVANSATPPEHHRFHFLDALRGLAAVLVIMRHSPQCYAHSLVTENSFVAVDFFSVLAASSLLSPTRSASAPFSPSRASASPALSAFIPLPRSAQSSVQSK